MHVKHTRCPAHPQEWSYFRGGLTTLDRDYGIFNKIHHDIGTHVVHHLFPQARRSGALGGAPAVTCSGTPQPAGAGHCLGQA